MATNRKNSKRTATKRAVATANTERTIGNRIDDGLDAFKASVAKPVGESRVKQGAIAGGLLGVGVALGVVFS